MPDAPRPCRLFDDVLGNDLVWARTGPGDRTAWLLLCFSGGRVLRLEGALDGVSLLCERVESAPPPVRPRETVFQPCVGRALLAVTPRVEEYESQHDGLGPSGVQLEFDGGRRVCVRHVDGDLVIDRTGRTDRLAGEEREDRRVG